MRELRGYLAWSAVLFGPVVLVLVLAAEPGTAGHALAALLALLAALLLAWLLTRDGQFAVPVVLLLLIAVALPHIVQLFQLARLSASMEPLTQLRQSLADYEKAHGRPPAALAELGPLPDAEIWGRDASLRGHYHPPSHAVQVVDLPADSGDGPPPGLRDAGGYAYDPKTGRLALACTGLDPKLGRPFFQK